MILPSWFRRRAEQPPPQQIEELQNEKLQLRQELAHVAATFSQSRSLVQSIAEQAIKSMHMEGRRR